MVDLLDENEAIPERYPDVTPRWVVEQMPEDNDPDADQVWQRIEAYIRTRYTPREVVWTLEGAEGARWTPPLSPVNSFVAEKWEAGAWTPVTLPEGPVGLCLLSDGTYRITAQVGAGEPPAAVQEAFLRLHEYSRGIADSFKNETAMFGNEYGAKHNWAARALQLSGAADALRPYRRQK